jgi:hypothetical protein
MLRRYGRYHWAAFCFGYSQLAALYVMAILYRKQLSYHFNNTYLYQIQAFLSPKAVPDVILYS